LSFINELKRRKVIRVGIAYAIGAWLVLQLTEVLSELLQLPAKIGPVVVTLVAIGFPVTLILAWIFEFTSEGLKRDSEVTADQRSSGRSINILIITLLAIALAYFVWESRFQDSSQTAPSQQASSETSSELAVGRSIAVLPFENLSGNPEDEYLADGLADTLLHKLAQISELKVIARNSSFQFKGSNIDVRELGETLGVEVLLEGSVQRSGNQVRIIAQLVQTSDGAHVWSQSFDDTTDNIFELQDRIATRIVDQFQLSLSEAERARLLQDGTDNPKAYDLVIRAMNQHSMFDEMVDTEAEQDERIVLLKQALELDPEYAMAWVYLSNSYNGMAFATDSAKDYERYVAESDAAANEALRLAPELPASQSAMGWVAHRSRDRMEAARYFRKALELDPNYLNAMSGLALQIIGTEPEEALRLLDRSLELDPTSAIVYRQKHFALQMLGRHDEAIEQMKKAIELRPDNGLFYNDLGDLLERKGRPDEGARYASKLLALVPTSFSGQIAMAEAWLAATEYEKSGQWVQIAMKDRDDSDTARQMEVQRLLASQQFAQAIEYLDEIADNLDYGAELSFRRLAACLGLKQAECATQQINLIRTMMQEQLSRGGMPPDFMFYAELAQLLVDELATPGYDSQQAATQLMEFDLMKGSRFFGPIYFARAGVLARLGKLEEAFVTLNQSIPSGEMGVFNIDLYSMDVEQSPLLDPMRELPEFNDWLQRYRERREAVLQRMRQMETRGEIMSPAVAERNLGS
jgi:TolB-like protein/Tfp pilus assembly protein PilF